MGKYEKICIRLCYQILTCQKIKVEHQKLVGLHQYLKIPMWKWESVTMDFLVGLPKTQKGYDLIWVIVDWLTKTTHFLPIKTTFLVTQYA